MAVTPAAIKARYPVFEPIADERIAAVIEDVESEVTASAWGDFLDKAQRLYTAHLLVIEDTSQDGIDTDRPRRLTSKAFGKAKDSYANPDDQLDETVYGRSYKRLRRQVLTTAVSI